MLVDAHWRWRRPRVPWVHKSTYKVSFYVKYMNFFILIGNINFFCYREQNSMCLPINIKNRPIDFERFNCVIHITLLVNWWVKQCYVCFVFNSIQQYLWTKIIFCPRKKKFPKFCEMPLPSKVIFLWKYFHF